MDFLVADQTVVFANMDLLWIICALAGGAFAALIGPNMAFGFTGVSIILGYAVLACTGEAGILNYISFGPVFGPHIAFAGGAAASAYAAKKGMLGGNGKDINTALASLGRPDVIWVAAIFGVIGYIINKLISLIPWFGSHTDAVAITVFIMGLITRVCFGSTGMFPGMCKPEGSNRWLEYQEKPSQLATWGILAGLLAGGISIMLMQFVNPNLTAEQYEVVQVNVQNVPFAISAICILFLASGQPWPVTHHMTAPGGLAAAQFFMATGNAFVALLAGIIFAVIGAFGGELMAKIFYYKGDTHIDPPAAIIWICNTLIWICLIPLA